MRLLRQKQFAVQILGEFFYIIHNFKDLIKQKNTKTYINNFTYKLHIKNYQKALRCLKIPNQTVSKRRLKTETICCTNLREIIL